ncbi:MAG: hypothetical protein J6B87_02905 [Clostridia bacterium]|nr:hypothetical protein [Clostridia bacterium]
MTQYADYKYYKEEYKGDMPETDFDRMSKKASAKIKANTFGRIDESNPQEEVKYCTCVIADALLVASKIEGKSSESVGSWSVSYDNNSKADTNSVVESIIKEFLSEVYTADGTPVLYRGC